VEVQIHSFLASALDRSEWLASRSGRFTPSETAAGIALDRRLDGPQSRSGGGSEEKKSHHCAYRELNPDRPAPVQTELPRLPLYNRNPSRWILFSVSLIGSTSSIYFNIILRLTFRIFNSSPSTTFLLHQNLVFVSLSRSETSSADSNLLVHLERRACNETHSYVSWVTYTQGACS
jgi:hypothetical protein